MGSLPSTSNRENALRDMPMGQPEGPIPQMSFPLPRCVKFTTKANYDTPLLKSPNRILENVSLNKEHMTGPINLVSTLQYKYCGLNGSAPSKTPVTT